MVRIELYDLLSKTQEYIAKYYAAVLTDAHKRDQLKSYIEKFILDGGYLVHGFTEEQLIDRLYSEMVEYSILTPFLGASDLDEINVNAWDDITLTYSDGSINSRLERLFEQIANASADLSCFEDSIIRQLIAQIRVESQEKLTIILHNGYRFAVTI